MNLRSGTLRHFAIIKNGTTPASGESNYWDGEIAWATPDDLGRLQGLSISETKRTVTQLAVVENNLNLVPGDTVLMSTRAPIGHMAITTRPMTFNQGCRALVPREGTWGPFLFYLLKSRVPELNASANGTTFVELSRDDLAGVRISLPPLEAQKRIAAFLNEKTAQIDGLIEKKRTLLKRLAEKRQAIITQAVTKGLNPAAPMKDSGVNWLGEIPAHWETYLIKRKYQVTYGVGGEIDRNLEIGTNLLSLPNISKDGRLILDEVPLTENNDHSLLLQAGDLLFNWRNGSTEHLGKTVFFDLPGSWTHVSFLLRIRAKEEDASTEYLRYFLNGLRESGFFASAKAGVNNTFNLFELSNLVIAAPPMKAEQLSIASYIATHLAKLDKLSRQIERSIVALLDYRSTLITVAVTGQIEGLR